MPGIAAMGVHVPRLRLARSTVAAAVGWLGPGGGDVEGERSLCNWDEDSLTMAVEASRSALAAGDSVQRVSFASTTFPFDDRSNAGMLAAATGLDDQVLALDYAGSQRAGTGALAQALAESAAAGTRATLVVAADRRIARPGSVEERRYGHGAAACVVGADDGIAALLGATHLAADFVDHYRESGERFDYTLEERWVRAEGWLELVPRAIRRLLAETGLEPGAIDRLLVPAPASVRRPIAAALGIRPEALQDSLESRCGNIGCAHPLLMLAAALEQASPGEHVLLVGFGQGVDALLFRVTPAIAQHRPRRAAQQALAHRREEASYTRFLAHCGLLAVDLGRRAERDNRTAQTVLWRKRDDITAFSGGRCAACGAVQFPRSRVCVNPACRETDTQAPHRLADSLGRIKTFTEDWLAYSQRPPLVYGNVEFAEGGNAFMEFTDFEPGEAAVGAPVRFVFRLKDVDTTRGFRRYFWKAAPAEDA